MIEKMLKAAERGLCDHCLGRHFASLGHGLSNAERGRAIRVVWTMLRDRDFDPITPERCPICRGLFSKIGKYAEMALEALSRYEYDTFLVGSRVPEELEEEDRRVAEELGTEPEPIKRELNREVGKIISSRTGKEVDFEDPDIKVIIDARFDFVELQVKPLFLYGRYRKLVRGISQTKWPVPALGGRSKYGTSVEELVADPVMEATGGTEHVFHGMGREDVDARMLGNGRPFVLEIRNPVRRRLDLEALREEINRRAKGMVEVLELRPASRRDVERVKSLRPPKSYEVGVRIEGGVDEEELREALRRLVGTIEQRTPRRVLHRRADMVRKRKVYSAELVRLEGDEAVIRVKCEAGTYVKELMHGDEGRTRPSLAELLGKKVEVKYLDVVRVHDEEVE